MRKKRFRKKDLEPLFNRFGYSIIPSRHYASGFDVLTPEGRAIDVGCLSNAIHYLHNKVIGGPGSTGMRWSEDLLAELVEKAKAAEIRVDVASAARILEGLLDGEGAK